MTSNVKRSHRMRSQRQTKRSHPQSKKKSSSNVAVSKNLPLSSKMVYIDMKRGKDADLVEEHLIKLGARVEAFLSADINYVISSFGPTKVEDVQKCSDENPKSPVNSVASPFSCIPSPSAPGPTESRKSAVSRGKALAHLARSKHKTSTVVTNAEKMGVKVVSVEVANKWMERELKKLDKEVKAEAVQHDSKLTKKKPKTKSKILKGCYIKFEASNCHYRPIKSILEKWPKVNPLAPPGLHPFVESKIKVKPFGNQRFHGFKHLDKMNKARKSLVAKPKEESLNLGQPKQVQQELLATPITTAGNVKRNYCYKKNANINKQQGYCDCCEMKFKSFEKHLKGEEHQSFARDKGNYESLDKLISEVPSTINFLQAVLLNHCMQIQKEMAGKIPETNDDIMKSTPKSAQEKGEAAGSTAAAAHTGHSSGMHDAEEFVPLSLHTPMFCHAEISPSRDQLLLATESNLTSQTDNLSQVKANVTTITVAEECPENSPDQRPQAVVIRRPVPSGIFTSPRRPRLPTPNKTPRGMERSMVFRDSPIGSLQPSPCSGSPTVSVGSVQVTTPVTNSIVGASCVRKKPRCSNAFLVRAIDFAKANSPNIEQVESRDQNIVDKNTIRIGQCIESIGQDCKNIQVKSTTSMKKSISEKTVVRRLSMENVKSGNTLSDLTATLSKEECNRKDLRFHHLESKRISPGYTQNSMNDIEMAGNSNLKVISDVISPTKTAVCDKTITSKSIPVKKSLPADNMEANVASKTSKIENVTNMAQRRHSFGKHESFVKGVNTKPSLQNISVTPIRVKDDDVMEVKLKGKAKIYNSAKACDLKTMELKHSMHDPSSHVLPCKATSKLEQISENSGISADCLNETESRKHFSGAKCKRVVTHGDTFKVEKTPDKTLEIKSNEDKALQDDTAPVKIHVHNPQNPFIKLEKDTHVDDLSHSLLKRQRMKRTKLHLQKHQECHEAEGHKQKSPSVDIKKNSSDRGDHNRVPTEETCLAQPDKSPGIIHVPKKRRLSRFCTQFTYKGLYANNGLGLEEADSGLTSIVVPNIAERVKNRRSVSVPEHSTHCADSDDFKPEKGNGEPKKSTMMKKQCRKRGRSQKSEKLALASVECGHLNQITTGGEKKNKSSLEKNQDSDIAVPNIADCVKRRRSCTQFNHEGQYANNGESSEDDASQSLRHLKQAGGNFSESTLVKLEVEVDKERHNSESLCKAVDDKKSLSHNLISDGVAVISSNSKHTEKSALKQENFNCARNMNEELGLSADYSKQSSSKEQLSVVFLNAPSVIKQGEKESRSPAVVIRRKKSLGSLHNLHKQRPDVDWGKSQESHEVLEEKNDEDCQNKSQSGQLASKCNVPTRPSHQKVLNERLPQIEESGPYVIGSPRFSSPKFKLKIKRLPSNEGYSSTIEEYYDNEEHQNSPLEIKRSKEACHEIQSIDLRELQNTTPKKDSTEFRSDSVDLLPSSPQVYCKTDSKKHTMIANGIDNIEKKQKFKRKGFISSRSKSIENSQCLHLQNTQGPPKTDLRLDSNEMSSKPTNTKTVQHEPETILLKQAGLEAHCFANSKKLQIDQEKSRKRKHLSTPLKANKKAKTVGKWHAKNVIKDTKQFLKRVDNSTETFHEFSDKDLHIDTQVDNTSNLEHEENDDKTLLSGTEEGLCRTLRNSKNIVDNSNQASDGNAAEDYLAFIPNFSSPGKATDSSWGDVCESYLSTSVRKPSKSPSPFKRLKSPTRHSRQRESLSPKKLFPGISPHCQSSPNQHNIRDSTPTRCESPSPRKVSVMSPCKGNRDKSQIVPGYRTPSKRSSNLNPHHSPVIHVDRVISFNMMSPQKLRSSPFQSK